MPAGCTKLSFRWRLYAFVGKTALRIAQRRLEGGYRRDAEAGMWWRGEV